MSKPIQNWLMICQTNNITISMLRSLDFVAPVSGKMVGFENTIRTVNGETDRREPDHKLANERSVQRSLRDTSDDGL